jgi:uncharacterized membrane protein YraQ (UPF0718 family)
MSGWIVKKVVTTVFIYDGVNGQLQIKCYFHGALKRSLMMTEILIGYLLVGILLAGILETPRMQDVIKDVNDILGGSLILTHLIRFILAWPFYLYEDAILRICNTLEEREAELNDDDDEDTPDDQDKVT